MVHGCDLSNWQDDSETAAILSDTSLRFAILKASQGTHYQDPTLGKKAVTCLQRNLLIGTYHYLEPDTDGAVQWDYYEHTWLERLRNLNTGPIIHACDYEGDMLHDRVAGDAIARAFIKRGQARGYKVGKYGSQAVSMTDLGEDWVWAAWWGNTPPPFHFDIWQSGSKPFDRDLWNGKPEGIAPWWARMGAQGRPHPRKVWYAHDPMTMQTLGPADYLTIGALITRHLRSYPLSDRLVVQRRP